MLKYLIFTFINIYTFSFVYTQNHHLTRNEIDSLIYLDSLSNIKEYQAKKKSKSIMTFFSTEKQWINLCSIDYELIRESNIFNINNRYYIADSIYSSLEYTEKIGLIFFDGFKFKKDKIIFSALKNTYDKDITFTLTYRDNDFLIYKRTDDNNQFFFSEKSLLILRRLKKI